MTTARESVAEVEEGGQAITLPKGMTMRTAIKTLQRRMEYEEETTEISETFDVFPWDGAHALQQAINAMFGWSQAEWIPGNWFTPDQPPQIISIEVGFGQTLNVPWGRFSLPNIKGYIETSFAEKNGLIVFRLVAHVLRKNERQIKDLANATRAFLRTGSIYRGKAIKVKFRDDRGRNEALPQPRFLDVRYATPDRLVFSQKVTASVATNLYTPIQRYPELALLKVPFKRGVLLVGHFGTGKTELAFTAAHLAQNHGITFLYCEDAAEFTQAINFAQQYAPSVVFCEDIDRVSKGERTDELNTILNTIDGIEAKAAEVMVVLTTNAVDDIHESLLRPGRMDAVIEIERPDPQAVESLVRLYARDLLDADEDLSGVGATMHGQIPAVIREVVERSKLAALKDTQPGEALRLTGAALAESALTMQMQINLLDRKPVGKPSDLEKAFGVIGELIVETFDTEGMDDDSKHALNRGAEYAMAARTRRRALSNGEGNKS